MSKVTLTISPEIPHRIIEHTFEGFLIRQMVTVLRTATGYDLCSRNGVEPFILVSEAMCSASESGSFLAERLGPTVRAAYGNKETLSLEDLAEALHKTDFDIVDVLQAVCALYPDEIPYFEVIWSVAQSGIPQHVRAGGGAQFVTSDGIETLSVGDWVKQKRSSFEHDLFQLKMEWEQVEPGKHVLALPHTHWKSIVHDAPEDYAQIVAVPDGYEVSIQSHGSPSERVAVCRSFKDAMLKGCKVEDQREFNQNDLILASMGLSPEEWTVELSHTGKPVAYYQAVSDVHLRWENDNWILMDGTTEMARSSTPEGAVEKASGPAFSSYGISP